MTTSILLHSATSASAPPRLHVRQAGDGAPLVLLHGLASSSRYWEPFLAPLSRAYHVLAPDLLGFGRSPKPTGATYSAEAHLGALIAALTPHLDVPMTLVGHSMGAILALHLVAARPELVERLVLVSLPVVGSCAWGHVPGGGSRRFHQAAVHTRAGVAVFNAGMRALRPVWPRIYPRFQPDVPRGAAEDVLLTDWSAYWGSLELLVYGSDVPALFAAARGPITLVHGDGDSVAPVEPVWELARSRPDVRFIQVVGARHNPAFTHPAAVYDALGLEVEGDTADVGPRAGRGAAPHRQRREALVRTSRRISARVAATTRRRRR